MGAGEGPAGIGAVVAGFRAWEPERAVRGENTTVKMALSDNRVMSQI